MLPLLAHISRSKPSAAKEQKSTMPAKVMREGFRRRGYRVIGHVEILRSGEQVLLGCSIRRQLLWLLIVW